MKFERNKNSKKYFLYGLILVVVLTMTITFIGSKANYRMIASIPLTEGKVIASPYDINIVALYLDGVEQDKDTIIPSGYKINEEISYCYKGSRSNIDSNARAFTDELGNHVFSGISKSSKCILYLDKDTNTKTMSELLESHYATKIERTVFNIIHDKTTYGVVYEALDDDGTTYYFAGNPLDNWIEFGGYYWRIIRINGDGSIRMIYQGRTQDESGNKLKPQAIGEETIIETSEFNIDNDDNAHVGFKFEKGQVHGLKEPSTAYKILNDWFDNSNLKQNQNFDKINVNAGFCGDRTPSSNDTTVDNIGGIGKEKTFYASTRLAPNRDSGIINYDLIKPTLNCRNNLDLYTYSGANKGNKSLKNPVGLITADEVIYSGIMYKDFPSNNSYLNTKVHFWTMTPSHYYNSDGAYAHLFYINQNGFLYASCAHDKVISLRPVINLRSDVQMERYLILLK